MGRRKASARASADRSAWMKSPSVRVTTTTALDRSTSTGFGRRRHRRNPDLQSHALARVSLRACVNISTRRYALIKDVLPSGPEASAQLERVKDPPPVQVFAPGFSVRQLPLDLTNINNVKYRPDGTLVAQAYDGKIWLLRDTDHDGLEDKAELFWDNPSGLRSPIGMDLTPPDYKLGNGVFVVGKTRLR